MFRWVELAFENSTSHLPFLSNFLNEIGVVNELKLMSTTASSWATDLKVLQQEFDQIRLGKGLCELVARDHEKKIFFSAELGWAECLVQANGSWWPRSFFKEALLLELAHLKSNIDSRKLAIIIGANGLAATMISALAQYGFSKFLVIDPDQKKAKEFVNRLSKLFFEQDTQSDSVDAIIAKAAESSVIVNCVPSGQSDEFVKDFCYFNYLTSKGLVIETNLYPVDSLLLSEARKVGIRSIPGYLIRGRADSLWVQQVTNASLRVEEYQMGLHLSCSRSTSA